MALTWIVTTPHGADELVDGWPQIHDVGVLAFFAHGQPEADGFTVAYAPGAWLTCREAPANDPDPWSAVP